MKKINHDPTFIFQIHVTFHSLLFVSRVIITIYLLLLFFFYPMKGTTLLTSAVPPDFFTGSSVRAGHAATKYCTPLITVKSVAIYSRTTPAENKNGLLIPRETAISKLLEPGHASRSMAVAIICVVVFIFPRLPTCTLLR